MNTQFYTIKWSYLVDDYWVMYYCIDSCNDFELDRLFSLIVFRFYFTGGVLPHFMRGILSRKMII